MFEVKFKDDDYQEEFENAGEVANYIYDRTVNWMLASGIHEDCKNAEPGTTIEVEYDDYSFIIQVK